MIEQIACKLNRNDEVPNVELAEKLVRNSDIVGIKEIADGLKDGNLAVVNDCIKVLYEIGYRKPELIADYAVDFITGLKTKNNRLTWGCMKALACISQLKADLLYEHLDEIITAYKKGSVITIDNSISVFANIAAFHPDYEKIIIPLLMDHLRKCRDKEVFQHAKRVSICINAGNRDDFIGILKERKKSLNLQQIKNIDKLMTTLLR